MVQEPIEALLRQKIGLDAGSIGSKAIARAVEQRRIACNLPDLPSYLNRLQTSAQELEDLIETVVVPETWFFRDKEPFVFLQKYVRSEWLTAYHPAKLRVLSVPCSTGEEPYSIAMALMDVGFTPNQFQIDAVDISRKALAKAHQAIYGKKSFRGEGLQIHPRYVQQTTNGYELSQFLRNSVNFIHGNLLESWFLANQPYHIIFCRNLLIYFDPIARSRTFQTLDRLLLTPGLLFVGSAETGQITASGFTPVRHAFAFAYRKLKPGEASKMAEPKMPEPKIAEPKISKMPARSAVLDNSILASQIPKPHSPDSKTLAAERSPATQPAIAPVRDFSSPIHQTPPGLPDLQTARHLANQGRLMEAANLCQSYLKGNLTNPQGYVLLGEVYQGLNNDAEAEQCFRKAIYLNPNHYEALIHLALLKEHSGNLAEAEILRQRIQRLVNPHNQ